jgi:hypothetical protein
MADVQIVLTLVSQHLAHSVFYVLLTIVTLTSSVALNAISVVFCVKREHSYLSRTKRYLLSLKSQPVPRSKHFVSVMARQAMYV